MTDTSPRIRRVNFSLETWNGVTQVLEKLYSARSRIAGARDIQVLPVSNVANAEKSLQKQNLSYELPYIGVAEGSTEPDQGSYNPAVMRKYGVKSRLSDDRSTWSILSLEPALITYQVVLVTDDIVTLLRMKDRWMANQLWSFRLDDPDYRMRIQVQADKSLQTPTSDPNSAGSEQFRLTGTLRAKSYVGYIWFVPSIYEVEIDTFVTTQAVDTWAERAGVEEYHITTIVEAPDHEPAV